MNPHVPVSRPAPPANYTSLSYRYLRLGMVAMIVLIFVSILIEVAATGWSCVQDSISAYFFTPVQLVFVSSWIAIGFCMLVLKGNNEWEEAFLNIAGILAPVVALVPTPHTTSCTSNGPIDTTPSVAEVSNNIHSYIYVGAFVLALAWIALYRSVPRSRRWWPLPSMPWPVRYRYTLPAITCLMIVGVIAFLVWPDAFIAWAHPVAAIVQTVVLIFVVFQNSVEIGRKANRNKKLKGLERYFFRNGYALIYWLMIGGAVLLYGVGWIVFNWSYWKLALEAGEILVFAGFWLWQTRDLEKSPLPRLDRAESPTPLFRKSRPNAGVAGIQVASMKTLTCLARQGHT